MALIPRLSSLWRNLVHRDRIDCDLDDEVGAVFELLVEEKMRTGRRPEEARHAAALELGRAEVIKDQLVTERFFDVLRAPPAVGRTLAGRHDSAVVLSERLARQLRPGRGHDLVGRVVTLADRPFPVVGIMPERVAFPSERVDLWLPARDAPAIELHSGRDARRFRLVARTKAGTGIEQVRDDARRVLSALAVEQPDAYGHLVVSADALQARLVAPVRPAIVIFVVGAALVLLVAWPMRAACCWPAPPRASGTSPSA